MRGSSSGGDTGRGAQGDARLADGLVHGAAQRRLDIAGRQGRQRGGRRFSWRRRRRCSVASARICFDFGMALVQRGAQRNHQRGDGAVEFSVGLDLGGVALPSARPWRTCVSISSVVRVCLRRARAAARDDSLPSRNSVSKVNLLDLGWRHQ